MGVSSTLLDASALVGFLNANETRHHACVEAVRSHRGALLTTEAVLTEAMYLLRGRQGGPEGCLDFFIAGGATIVPSSPASLVHCKEIKGRYDDLPADFADATLVSLADDLRVYSILTLDRRGFSVYRGTRGESFEIRP